MEEREIKFRFFRKLPSPLMIYPDGDYFINHLGKAFGLVRYPDKNELMQTDVLSLQYVGLKDKNGIEIYEGDIIEFHANYCAGDRNGYKVGVIKYNNAYMRFEIEVPGIDESYDCKTETDEWYYKREVIGNIYEHPHLLNKDNGK